MYLLYPLRSIYSIDFSVGPTCIRFLIPAHDPSVERRSRLSKYSKPQFQDSWTQNVHLGVPFLEILVFPAPSVKPFLNIVFDLVPNPKNLFGREGNRIRSDSMCRKVSIFAPSL